MNPCQLTALVFVALWNTGSGWQQQHHREKDGDHGSVQQRMEPRIDTKLSTGNVTVIVGKQIILSCFVDHLGNQSVSWIRHSDSGLLSVNDFVYTRSNRIKVFHDKGSPEWKLSINPVQMDDQGLYDCQVSTTPHSSHSIAINVIEPKTTILGNEELFIEAGSTINLTCIIQTGTSGETHIYWNYNGKIITYDRRRGGTIVIDKRDGETLTSLIISQADLSDSGTYTCNPSSLASRKVVVHVTTGSDAAMRPNAIVRSGQPSLHPNQFALTATLLTAKMLLLWP